MDEFFRKELAMKRLVTGILGGSLVLGSLIGGASPAAAATAPPKICYFDNETELRYTSNSEINRFPAPGLLSSSIRSIGPTDNYPNALPFDPSMFSGDCPPDFQPVSETAPTYYYYRDGAYSDTASWGDFAFYHQNGTRKYYSPLMRLLLDRQISWRTQDNMPSESLNLVLFFQETSYNSAIGQTESSPGLRYYEPYFEYNRLITYQPFAYSSASIWTGNAATENCDYVDESTCPGGYKFDNYLLIPKNPISVKWKALDTKISAKAGKKKGKFVTVTVNVDRQYTDVNGNDVKRYAGDKVTIMRDGKIVGTAKVKKNGVAKVKIKDIKGDNVYTVTIPETNRNWDATTTFIR
jgi:hypothetical protein